MRSASHRIVSAIFVALLTLSHDATCAQDDTSSETIFLEGCVVAAVDTIRIPALSAGLITELSCREEQLVEEGGVMMTLDSRQATSLLASALADLELAQFQSENRIALELAEAKHEVARTEFKINEELSQFKAVPKLELIKSELAMKSADLERQLALQEIENARIALGQKKQAVALAQIKLDDCVVHAPLSGVVSELYRRSGEWVTPGEPVAKLIRMDRLRVGGRLNLADYAPEQVTGRTALILLRTEVDQAIEGVVTSVSSEIEPNGDFRFWVEFENQRVNTKIQQPEDLDPAAGKNGWWLLRPGTLVDVQLSIPLKPSKSK